MDRQGLLSEALSRCKLLSARYPADRAITSIVTQLEYLTELSQGKRSDSDRLKDIIIGVLAGREIAPLDPALAEILYQVDEAAEQMKYTPKGVRDQQVSTTGHAEKNTTG